MARILTARSGGVDSAAAAALLVEQGHEVVAAYMKNWVNDENIPGECPWERDIEDALGVCRKLGIEFRVVDLIEQYRSTGIALHATSTLAMCEAAAEVLLKKIEGDYSFTYLYHNIRLS